MKNLVLILALCMSSLGGFAQVETQDTAGDSAANNYADNGEAGGVNEAPVEEESNGNFTVSWLYLALGAAALILVTALATRALSTNKGTTVLPAEEPEEEKQSVKNEAKPKEPKVTAAELKKLKQELKEYQSQVQQLTAARATAEQQLDIYRNFDNGYFNEAFRKLVLPMSNALESGSRKEITENLLKMMMHFSSLTRYKIAKKQPFDEANIHYLLNQKGAADTVFTEVNGNTPIDKIPKNIHTLIALLKEQNSAGLDDSIIAGYKIKNL